MASIRKRGSKYQVQIRRDGQPPFSKTFTDKSDAIRWGREQDRRADLGEAFDQPKPALLTLKEAIERYAREVTPTKRSAPVEKYQLRAVERHTISALPLNRITSEAVAMYRDDRLKTVTGCTVRKELSLLRHILKIAANEWCLTVPDNPVAKIRQPPPGQARVRRLGVDEAKALEAALAQCQNQIIQEATRFALATGMRRGELLSLLWNDVDLSNRTAHLRMTKNGESRTVPLSQHAINIIERLTIHSETVGRVFPVSANALRLAWEHVKRRAGITDLHFHDLRHEAISRFFELGLSIPEVSLISGHKDARMLFRYTHLKPASVAEKLANLMGETGQPSSDHFIDYRKYE